MVTFLAAVAAKYEYKEPTSTLSDNKLGQLVGGDRVGKAQALHLLTRVYLPDANVTCAGGDAHDAVEQASMPRWSPSPSQLPRTHAQTT